MDSSLERAAWAHIGALCRLRHPFRDDLPQQWQARDFHKVRECDKTEASNALYWRHRKANQLRRHRPHSKQNDIRPLGQLHEI